MREIRFLLWKLRGMELLEPPTSPNAGRQGCDALGQRPATAKRNWAVIGREMARFWRLKGLNSAYFQLRAGKFLEGFGRGPSILLDENGAYFHNKTDVDIYTLEYVD
jgi:hypothetical protein